MIAIKDNDLPATGPLPLMPRIRYTDAGGNVHEGWYAFHVGRSVCPAFDELKPEDCMHLIVSDGFADWNMPQDVRVQAISPDGGTVELPGMPDVDELLEVAMELEGYAFGKTGRDLAGFAERIRKAVG